MSKRHQSTSNYFHPIAISRSFFDAVWIWLRMTLTIRTLSAAATRDNLEDLIAVASDVPGEYWAAENFLEDRPGKWRLSFGLWRTNRLIGYAILSQRAARHIHLHHFMINAAERNRGCGKAMLDEMTTRCSKAGAEKLTLKSLTENFGAIRFYARHGFSETGAEPNHIVMTKTL